MANITGQNFTTITKKQLVYQRGFYIKDSCFVSSKFNKEKLNKLKQKQKKIKSQQKKFFFFNKQQINYTHKKKKNETYYWFRSTLC